MTGEGVPSAGHQDSAQRFFRLPRFSLAHAMLLITLVALALGIRVESNRKQDRAIARLESLGAMVVFDYQWKAPGIWDPNAKPPSAWERRLGFGRGSVVEVQLFAGRGMRPEQFSDDDAALIAHLRDLEWLVLMDTKLSDKGLEHLARLGKLERLDVEGSRVTEQGGAALQKRIPGLVVYP